MQSFAVAGSIVIFIIAMEMVLGVEFFKTDNDGRMMDAKATGIHVRIVSIYLFGVPMEFDSFLDILEKSFREEYNKYTVLLWYAGVYFSAFKDAELSDLSQFIDVDLSGE